jgi:phosphoglycerate dehydrogenase-like enzyme
MSTEQTRSPGDRPAILLAMLDGMLEHAFTAEQLDRLQRAGRLIDPMPLSTFDGKHADELLAEAEIIVGHWGCPPLTSEVLARAPRLRMLAYAAGTVKWQVTDAVWERDLVVTSAAAANALPVAEYTLAMILLANKGVLLFRERLRDPDSNVPLMPRQVGNAGKLVGIVGASHVGRRVIDLLQPFDVSIALYDPYVDEMQAKALGAELFANLDELCAAVDVLSVHAPDIPATRGMIGGAQLARLRDGTTLINTARPALVDQDALLGELRTGRIAAILDVTEPEPLPTEHELLSLPNVFVTPHVAGSIGAEVIRMSELAVQEVERYVAGEPPKHPVGQNDIDRIA